MRGVADRRQLNRQLNRLLEARSHFSVAHATLLEVLQMIPARHRAAIELAGRQSQPRNRRTPKAIRKIPASFWSNSARRRCALTCSEMAVAKAHKVRQ